jgi:nucleoside-diphosphate-sugar epimerase
MANATGTLNVLVAAKDAGVKRVVVASSSSVYGDTEVSPKHEGLPLRPKTPYAFTKVSTEEYARIFHSVYGLETIALRYFNVFGPRQNIKSAYAAVIPIFLDNLLAGKSPTIFGDGLTSRDFTYVANVVHGNLLAMEAASSACGRVYNMGAGGQFTLNELYASITEALDLDMKPTYGPKRAGDIDHSKADINLAREHLGYAPVVAFKDGVKLTVEWFRASHLAPIK